MIVITRSLRLHINWTLIQFFYQTVLNPDISAPVGHWQQLFLSFNPILFACSMDLYFFAVSVLMALMFFSLYLCVGDCWRCKPQPPHLWATLQYPPTPQPSQSPKNKYSSRVSVVACLIWLHAFERFRPGLIHVNSVQYNQFGFQSSCSDRCFYVSEFVAKLLQTPARHELTCTTRESVKHDMHI